MPGYPHPTRVAACAQFIEKSVYDTFVIDALVPEAVVIEFQRLELDAEFIWDVFELNRGEVGLSRLGTNTREFRARVGDGVIAVGGRVRKSLQNLLRHSALVYLPPATPLRGEDYSQICGIG